MPACPRAPPPPAGHSQLSQVLCAGQVVEAIQGPIPGASQSRGAVGAAGIGAGCGARRCQYQPSQQAARPRSPAVPAKLPAPSASQHRGGARLAQAGQPSVRSQLQLPGLPRHVRWAVLKTQPPGKGGASGPRPAPPCPSSPPPCLLSDAPRSAPSPVRGPQRQPSPRGSPPAPADAEGPQQNASEVSAEAGGGKLIRYFSQLKAAAFLHLGRREDDCVEERLLSRSS